MRHLYHNLRATLWYIIKTRGQNFHNIFVSSRKKKSQIIMRNTRLYPVRKIGSHCLRWITMVLREYYLEYWNRTLCLKPAEFHWSQAGRIKLPLHILVLLWATYTNNFCSIQLSLWNPGILQENCPLYLPEVQQEELRCLSRCSQNNMKVSQYHLICPQSTAPRQEIHYPSFNVINASNFTFNFYSVKFIYSHKEGEI